MILSNTHYSYVLTEPDIKVQWLAILLRIPDYRAPRQLAILAEVFDSPTRLIEVYITSKIRHDCWHKMSI